MKTNLVLEIFGVSRQKSLTLFLFCLITLCLPSRVIAQQPTPTNIPLQSSTLSSAQIASLEENIKKLEAKVQRLESKPKDFWDKAEAISGLVSGGLVALLVGIATYVYNMRQQKNEVAQNQREIAVSHVKIVHDFIPHLQSEKSQDVQAALTAIGYLGTPFLVTDLITELARIYRTEIAAIAVLKMIASSSHHELAEQAKKSLKALEAQIEEFDVSTVQTQVLDLAREYEQTRVEPIGDQRTREMEAILAEMKGLASAGSGLLQNLKASSFVGERLAAIAFLQEKPRLDYLPWLAEQIAEDSGAFHGYHAAIALRNAANVFWKDNRQEVERAFQSARELAVESYGIDILKKDAFKVLLQFQVIKWAEDHRAENPYDMGPKNYRKCLHDLGYPGGQDNELVEENGKLKYQ